MAGDWIKMREDLYEDPAVLWMAEQLKTRPEHIVGYLHRFWGWVSRNCVPDSPGQMSRSCPDSVPVTVPISYVESVLGLPGFVEMLCDKHVDWARYDPETCELVIPKIDRHLSEGGKTRALAAEKKRRQRAKDPPRKVSRKCPHKTGTREEKRREESLPPIVPRGGLPVSDGFDEWWQSYPSHRQGSRQKAVAAYADAQTLVSQESLLAALRAYAASDSGKGKFCLGAVRWLEERRWEDNPASWQNMDGNGHAPTGRVVNDAGRLAEKKHAAAVRRLKARGVEVTDAAVKKEMNDG